MLAAATGKGVGAHLSQLEQFERGTQNLNYGQRRSVSPLSFFGGVVLPASSTSSIPWLQTLAGCGSVDLFSGLKPEGGNLETTMIMWACVVLKTF